MFGKSLKERATALGIKAESKYACIQALIIEGYFDTPRSSAEVVLIIRETFGQGWKTTVVQT
jgi:hypothetical protein